MNKMIDLFCGSGAFSLGFHNTKKFETVLFCDNDKYSHGTIKKNFKNPKISTDINELISNEEVIEEYKDKIHTVSLGFPCQDISIGGKGKGLTKGARSSLWKSAYKFCKKIRPKFMVIENVDRLLNGKGMGVVLKDLNKMGMNAEWAIITARSVGLPHLRKRVFIVAYSKSHGNLNIIHKSILNSVKSSSLCNQAYQADRLVYNLTKEEEAIRKKRIHQIGNSIVPQISEAIALSLLGENKKKCALDTIEELNCDFSLDEQELEAMKLPNAGAMINSKLYKREDLVCLKRDNHGVLFPTVVSSDHMNILAKNDTYKLTKNGRIRRYYPNGNNASLNLSRFVKFFPHGPLKLEKLRQPETEGALCPDFCEKLMGFPEGWTKH